MKKISSIFLIFFFLTSSYAVDFSEMSTQELIEIIGFVKKENQGKFQKELKSRVSTMTQNEKKKYKKNLQRIKEKR